MPQNWYIIVWNRYRSTRRKNQRNGKEARMERPKWWWQDKQVGTEETDKTNNEYYTTSRQRYKAVLRNIDMFGCCCCCSILSVFSVCLFGCFLVLLYRIVQYILAYLYLFEWNFKWKRFIVVWVQGAFFDTCLLFLQTLSILHNCNLHIRIWKSGSSSNIRILADDIKNGGAVVFLLVKLKMEIKKSIT